MIFYFIPLILIVASLIVIIFIIIKKIPDLAAINVESIAKEKEVRVKNRIITERLARRFFSFKKILIEIFTPLKKTASSIWSGVYQKAVELEKDELKKSQLASSVNESLKKSDTGEKISNKLIEAKKFLADQNFTRTEEVCISIVELDAKNLDVYEILTELYSEKKEYKKARETCRHSIKLLLKNGAQADGSVLKHQLANCYADLGWVYQLENKNNYALSNFQKAVKIEPHNPRFLDLLLKICIILKNKNLAQKTFEALKKADPENQKLVGLSEEISNI